MPPSWFKRFEELRSTNMTYDECAKVLTAENYKAKHGGMITVDTLRCFVSREKRLEKLRHRPRQKRKYWVSCDLDGSYEFYSSSGEQPKYYGHLLGPFDTFEQAKSELRKAFKYCIDELKEGMALSRAEKAEALLKKEIMK